jgi:hypothetical protein
MEPMASRAWLPSATRPSSQRTDTPAVADRSMPSARAPLSSRTPRSQEVVLEGGGDLGVLLGQHLLAADDERDLAAERGEHVHELHAGDPRTDDDQVLGQLGGG